MSMDKRNKAVFGTIPVKGKGSVVLNGRAFLKLYMLSIYRNGKRELGANPCHDKSNLKWYCSREYGHTGPHVACNSRGPLEVWMDE